MNYYFCGQCAEVPHAMAARRYEVSMMPTICEICQ
jgi:hypothetical protein